MFKNLDGKGRAKREEHRRYALLKGPHSNEEEEQQPQRERGVLGIFKKRSSEIPASLNATKS